MSQTAPQKLPAMACRVHEKLGLLKTSFAFDINLGCSAYPYGLWIAGSLMKSGPRRILLLAGDTISQIVNPSDRGTSLLFGDAGTATALEKVGNDIWPFLLGTDGKGADSLQTRNNDSIDILEMDGPKVFEFTLTEVPRLIKLLDKINRSSNDFYLLHQANRFMLQNIRRKCKLSKESFLINIEDYGNTSCASIPLLITSKLKSILGKDKKQLALIGFGVGFSWAGVSLPIGPISVLKVISTYDE